MRIALVCLGVPIRKVIFEYYGIIGRERFTDQTIQNLFVDSPKDGSTFKIDFSTLYSTLCRIVTIDQATLLLYLLLHRNQRFYKYVMAQQNLQQLVRD